MTTPIVTRFPGVYSRSDSRVYQFGLKPPDDLRHHFVGDWAIRCSLRTSILAEANAKAKALHAEWAEKFAALLKRDNPTAVDLSPVLAAAIAEGVRRHVLQADDNMRAFPDGPNGLLSMERRKRLREIKVPRNSLLIDISDRTKLPGQAAPLDPLCGLGAAQRDAVARLNAQVNGAAAVDLAAGNLRSVLPLAADVAADMGLSIDWTSQAGRAGLTACLKAYRVAARELCQRDAGEVVDTPAVVALPDAKSEESLPTTSGERMSDAFVAWQGLGRRKPKTVSTFGRHVELFAEIMGDPELRTLRRADGVRFRDALTRRAIKELNTAASADNVLTTIKALTNVAVNQEWLASNPFERLAVTEGGRDAAGREPWTPEDLPRVFDSALFTAYALPSGNSVATKAGADAAYWVPLLCLYTGARPSEVCQLWTDDVSVVGDCLVIEFREDEARGTSLKNYASWRALPVHSELIRLGFRDYWSEVVASTTGPGWLFPALPKSGANGAAGQFGQWFGQYKTAQGFGTPKKSLHSFRHTVETELGFAEVSDTLVDAITGHEGKGIGRKVYAATIRRQAVRLRPSLERLIYPGLTLPRVFKCAR